MLKDITLGQYFPGRSPIHLLDPRVKLVLALSYIVILFLVTNWIGYALVAGFVVAIAAMSRISIKYLFKGLKPILFIVAFTMVLNVFFMAGPTVLFEWRFVRITQEGVRTAIFMALRLVLLVLGTSLLTLTTSPIALTDALERLLGPLKRIGLPVHELAMMMTIALRFIPTLLDETDKIMKAQSARGADFESGNLLQRAKAMVPLLVPLFVSAFRRADELAMAMEARCYRGGTQRTRMVELHMVGRDWAAIGIVAALCALVLLPRWL